MVVDFNLMDNITAAIEDRADTVIRQTEELNKSPVYKYPFEYARDNDELERPVFVLLRAHFLTKRIRQFFNVQNIFLLF